MSKKYQVMPALSDKEYEALKGNIKKNDVLVPVIYDENGNIIDGFHRVQICKELDIEDWPSITITNLNEVEKRSLARKLNSARRQLSQEQKRELIKDQLKDTPEWSNRRIADMLGVGHKTIIKYRKELEESGEIPQLNKLESADDKKRPAEKKSKTIINPTEDNREITEQLIEESAKEEDKKAEKELDKIMQGEQSISGAKKKLDEEKKKVEKQKKIKKRKEQLEEKAEKELQFDKYEIHNSDLMEFEPEKQLDLILTDPPYGIKYIDEWKKLGKFAGTYLKENGFLITYSGQTNIIPVLKILNNYLDWYWMFSLRHSGNNQLITHRNIFCGWKPILVFQNGFSKTTEKTDDVIEGSGREKSEHEWQQSLDELGALVDHFSKPGDTVCDPFMGSGTTILSAIKKKRYAIGIEKDIVTFDDAKERLENYE